MKTNPKDSLNRAVNNLSMTNYPAIIAGFIEKGIPAEQIIPRENVFTFNAWKALNRIVKKGEHGVKVVTWVKIEKEGNIKTFPKTTTVFHISQTEEIK